MCSVSFDRELFLLQDVCIPIECSEDLIYRNGFCESRYLLDPPTRYLYLLKISSATPFNKTLVWGPFIGHLCDHVIMSINTSLPDTPHDICQLSTYIPVTHQTSIRSIYMDVDMSVPLAHKSLRNILPGFTLRTFNFSDNTFRTHQFSATISHKWMFSCPPGLHLYCKSNVPSFSRFIKVFSHSYHANTVSCKTRISNHYALLDKMLICPKLCMKHFYFKVNSKHRQLCFANSSICFWETDFILEKSKLCVCMDDYISKLQKSKKRDIFQVNCKKLSISQIKLWITFIGTIISNISLTVTIIVYLCVHQLRTLPGKNNLVLSVVILAAQICYHYGIGFTDSPILCKIIGGLVHYLWMTMFFWTNVCTFHMIRVFSFNNKSVTLPQERTATFVKYCLYSFVSPIIFVASNILVSLNLSDYQDFGYGGCICYISSSAMVLYTLFVPAFGILLANIVMFLLVIGKISKLHGSSQMLQQNRNYLLIYLKMSSITGVAWLTSFINEFVENDILGYISSVMASFIGLYIFIAFICNRRTFASICKAPRIVIQGSVNGKRDDTIHSTANTE